MCLRCQWYKPCSAACKVCRNGERRFARALTIARSRKLRVQWRQSLQDPLPLKIWCPGKRLRCWDDLGRSFCLVLTDNWQMTTCNRVRRAGANLCPLPQCNIGNTTRRKARNRVCGPQNLKQPGPSPADAVRLRRAGWGRRNQSRCEALVEGDQPQKAGRALDWLCPSSPSRGLVARVNKSALMRMRTWDCDTHTRVPGTPAFLFVRTCVLVCCEALGVRGPRALAGPTAAY